MSGKVASIVDIDKDRRSSTMFHSYSVPNGLIHAASTARILSPSSTAMTVCWSLARIFQMRDRSKDLVTSRDFNPLFRISSGQGCC